MRVSSERVSEGRRASECRRSLRARATEATARSPASGPGAPKHPRSPRHVVRSRASMCTPAQILPGARGARCFCLGIPVEMAQTACPRPPMTPHTPSKPWQAPSTVRPAGPAMVLWGHTVSYLASATVVCIFCQAWTRTSLALSSNMVSHALLNMSLVLSHQSLCQSQSTSLSNTNTKYQYQYQYQYQEKKIQE